MRQVKALPEVGTSPSHDRLAHVRSFWREKLAQRPGSRRGPGPRGDREAALGTTLVGERAVDLHLRRARDEPFLLATLAIRREVRGFAVGVEGGVVLVLLVEDEEVGILRRPVRAVHEAARLRL